MDYVVKYKADSLDFKDHYPEIPPETLDLMLSMLHRTQQDLQSVDDKVYRDAKRWIDRNDQRDYFLSFESICRNLDLDPDKARERIYHVAGENREERAV